MYEILMEGRLEILNNLIVIAIGRKIAKIAQK